MWAMKAQCSRSHLPPLLSCTMADSALTLEVADAAAAVTSVSPLPHTQPYNSDIRTHACTCSEVVCMAVSSFTTRVS